MLSPQGHQQPQGRTLILKPSSNSTVLGAWIIESAWNPGFNVNLVPKATFWPTAQPFVLTEGPDLMDFQDGYRTQTLKPCLGFESLKLCLYLHSISGITNPIIPIFLSFKLITIKMHLRL